MLKFIVYLARQALVTMCLVAFSSNIVIWYRGGLRYSDSWVHLRFPLSRIYKFEVDLGFAYGSGTVSLSVAFQKYIEADVDHPLPMLSMDHDTYYPMYRTHPPDEYWSAKPKHDSAFRLGHFALMYRLYGESHYRLHAPCWFCAVATAIVPGFWLRRYLKARCAGSCGCKGCGYDLRATPNRCPECGRDTDQAMKPGTGNGSDTENGSDTGNGSGALFV